MNRIVIKGAAESVQRHQLPDLVSPAKAPESVPCETAVEVLRQNGAVVGLEVRCACGEVTVVEFEYPQNAS